MFWAVPLPNIRISLTVHLALVSYSSKTAYEQGRDGSARKLSTNLYDIYHYRVYSE